MRRLLAVALVVVILVGTVPVAPVQGVHTPQDADGPLVTDESDTPPKTVDRSLQRTVDTVDSSPKSVATADSFDSVEFHITVYENGTAEWTFTYQRTLSNDTERQQFEAFAAEFNNNSTDMWRDFQSQARQLASAGQNYTGRAMKAQNFHREAYVGGLVNDNRGIVKMSFQWTGFAYAEAESVVIGDVFDGGLYVADNQSLVVHTGPGLDFESADPMSSAEPSGEGLESSESLTWEGEQNFNDQRPRVKFSPVETTTTRQTETTQTTTPANVSGPPGGGGDGDGDGWSPLMMFIGAVVVLLGLAAAFAWRQGDFGSHAGDAGNTDSGDGGGGAAATTQRSSEPAVSDEELLTDEARVKKLLDRKSVV